ncbi:DUF1330 domain-containing protein [Streptomyces sp. SID8379]|uniref:DUF1330 domain-containing protein n=1 Tax=unclassified Streptomyces TaxID=2593676 RepID=UPI000379F69C|nr:MULTISPECIES: DUF1330 domain-containing protein [unclassified Streptomyces]MYW64775.1 DUF1330 domain-containing protein [Streptomyces sp. SID8379]
MTAYVIAVLHTTPTTHPDVFTYIERVQATFTPYGGRFLVHGTEGEWVEGPRLGGVVVLEFPDLKAAHTWYESPAYQEILPLRTDHLPGSLVFLEGAPDGYEAARTAAAMREAASGQA